MSSTATLPVAPRDGDSLDWIRTVGLGFAYWAAVLIALEPGNVDRAIRNGYQLALHHEVIRIFCAASLGAVATPLLLPHRAGLPAEHGRAVGRLDRHKLLSRLVDICARAATHLE
jgi:hypothetical protein